MRMIDMIVVHCSATRSNRRYTLEQLRHDHVAVNGWRDIETCRVCRRVVLASMLTSCRDCWRKSNVGDETR